MADAKYKIGDKLRCKPGFKRQDSDPEGGGSGYEADLEFEVREISTPSHYQSYKGHIYWPTSGSVGIYEFALEKVDSVVNTYLIY